MKKILIALVLTSGVLRVNAQDIQKTIVLLEKLGSDGFQNDIGKKLNTSQDGTLTFYEPTFQLPFGEAQVSVGNTEKVSAVTWKIPMDNAKKFIPDFEKMLTAKTEANKDYFLQNEGSKEEGFEMKTLMMEDVITGEPVMKMMAIYSINSKDNLQSYYIIQMFGE